jgi:hypothetical protein
MDAEANIGEADGPKGAPQERRVIHFDFHDANMDPGFRRDDANWSSSKILESYCTGTS